MGGTSELPDGVSKYRLRPGGIQYRPVYCRLCADSGGTVPDSDGGSAVPASGWQNHPVGFSSAHGDPGGFRGAGVEGAVSRQWAGQPCTSGHGNGYHSLDGLRGGVLDAGTQLSVEKPGLYHGPVGGRVVSDTGKLLRGSAGRWGFVLADLLPDYPAEPERNRIHHCGAVGAEFLQGLPGGLAGGRGLSGRKHVSDAASLQQLVPGTGF